MRLLIYIAVFTTALGGAGDRACAQSPGPAQALVDAAQTPAQPVGQTQSQQIFVVQPLRAGEIITQTDLVIPAPLSPEARELLHYIVGKTPRNNIFPGKPVTPRDVTPVQVVSRNDIVSIEFTKGLLQLTASGRALGAGAVGEPVRVMNIDSKATLSGVVTGKGKVAIR